MQPVGTIPGARWVLAALALCCRAERPAPEAPRHVAHRDASPAAVDAPIEAPGVDAQVLAYAVDDDRPWRPVLYTWTPAERAAELARGGPLLVRGAFGSPMSPFTALLNRLRTSPGSRGRLARALLYEPPLHRYRYAWSNAYATALGFQGRRYGTALVRVVLRDDALVLRLDPSDPAVFRLYDRDQREVPLDDLDDLRPRIGAVLHVRTGSDVAAPFREYIVCNEGAIASWSLGARDGCDELARERALVARVRAARPTLEGPIARWWRDAGDTALGPRWASTLATGAAHYVPTDEHLAALEEVLSRCDTDSVREVPGQTPPPPRE